MTNPNIEPSFNLTETLRTASVDTVLTAMQEGNLDISAAQPDVLFEFAKRCIDNGQFGARNDVYEVIAQHPDASPDDKRRVAVNTLDQLRRQNTTEAAEKVLVGIDKLGTSDSPVIEAERLQVKAQASVIMVQNGHAEYSAQAVQAARDILDISSTEGFPVDKRGFYVQSLIGVKIGCKQFDEETMATLDLLKTEVIEKLSPSTEDGSRQISQFHATRARVSEQMGNIESAASDFYRSFEVGRGAYYQVGGAAECVRLLAESFPDSVGDMIFEDQGKALANFVERAVTNNQDDAVSPVLNEALVTVTRARELVQSKE